MKPEDIFVFYIATHGENDISDYYLLTSDTGSLSSHLLKKTAISKKELKELLLSIPARKRVVILDSCYSGVAVQDLAILRSATTPSILKRLSKSIGASVLASTMPTEVAFEGYKGHGVFTYILIQGLEGKADYDKDGFVDIYELVKYTDKKVPYISKETFGKPQYPTTSIIGTNFIIGEVK